MRFFIFFLLLIASVTFVCAVDSDQPSFDSIKTDLIAAETSAQDFVKVTASTSATANTIAQIVASLKATSSIFIDITSEVYSFQGLFTSVQVDACLTLLDSITSSIETGTKSLIQSKSTFKPIDDQGKIADQLAALDGSASAVVTGLVTVFPANAQQKLKRIGELISTEAYNACEAYDATFDSIKSKLSSADGNAQRFNLLASANPVTADAAAQIVSALLATHNDFIETTSETYTFQGTLTSSQTDEVIKILNSLQVAFDNGIPKLVNNKAAIAATGRTDAVAQRLAALDGSAGALVAGIQTIVPGNKKQEVQNAAGNIGQNAYNGCTAFGGKAC